MRFSSLIFAAALALPQAATACAQLSENVWMCDRGTRWQAAEWDEASEGSARMLVDLALTFTEEWPGFDIGDDITTLEERLATYDEWVAGDGQVPLERMHTDRIVVGDATSVRAFQRDAIEGRAFMSVVMLTEIGTSRLMLFLDAPDTTPVDEMDKMSREILALLKDTCADEITCTDQQVQG